MVNRSNAYGNTMVALLSKTIEETGWFVSPFARHFRGDYGRLLLQHFWVDDHFRDTLGDETVSGEANIWPFYTGVVGDPKLGGGAVRSWVSSRWIMIGEESMLWSAIFLDALENLDLTPAYLSDRVLPLPKALVA